MRSMNYQPPAMPPIPPPKAFQQMSSHIRFLEQELERINEEVQVRVDRSRREKSAREALTRECDMLREDLGETRSELDMREQQINDLEQQIRVSRTQLAIMKRRNAEARAKASPSPGTISSFPKDLRTVGTQINELNELEEKIERLKEALMIERKRNQRIKSLIVEGGGGAVMPPLPVHSTMVKERVKSRFVMQNTSQTVINRTFPQLSRQSFIQFNSKFITEPPPLTVSTLRTDSPVLISPIKKVNSSSYSTGFAVFEDKENSPDKRAGVRANVVLREVNRENNIVKRATKVPEISSPIPRVQPPPFIPQLNLEHVRSPNQGRPTSSSSESAIKRAVAAAVEKRKQLASQGILLGSSRSNISTSSFMTNSPINVSGVKARFCLPVLN